MDLILVTSGLLALIGAGSLTWALRSTVKWRSDVRRAEMERDDAHTIKNDFVAMVSHELRTPLTSIAGFAETLGATWEDISQPEVDEFLSIITEQASILGELVEDILVIPRLDADRLRLWPEVFDLSNLVHEAVTAAFPGPGGTVTSADGKKTSKADISVPGGVLAYGDPRRVNQVLRNLINNAIKYGGTQVLIEGFPFGEHFVVVVSDNGSGIDDRDTNRVFEHFEQVSKGDSRSSTGIGLGLPIARKLARAMGGDVWYEKRFPTGSRFCFSVTQTAEVQDRILAERAQAEADRREGAIAR
jgi:hypothetical protein